MEDVTACNVLSSDNFYDLLLHYGSSDISATQRDSLKRMLSLLQVKQPFDRNTFPAHFTASAFIINGQDPSTFLLLQHRKLGIWIQPGGHCDGDSDVLAAAVRELAEETGLKNISLFSDGIFDLDIHSIPATSKEPEHEHFDIRFCFIAQNPEELSCNDESTDAGWFSLKNSPNHEAGILRMARKTETLSKSEAVFA
ncbi:MAG: NUDIX hydrolase [Deltaproteobacteria bacterium]|nr:NUDIX hydrolase [Deltaproteobacteria bacterium]